MNTPEHTALHKNQKIWSVLFAAAYLLAYIYLRYTGLWVRYRWTGLALGSGWAVMYVLLGRKQERKDVLSLHVVFIFSLIAILALGSFLRGGGLADGFLASSFLGFAARELYVRYKSRNVSLPNDAAQ